MVDDIKQRAFVLAEKMSKLAFEEEKNSGIVFIAALYQCAIMCKAQEWSVKEATEFLKEASKDIEAYYDWYINHHN